MSDAIHLPAIWEIDTIADACAKLAELTGHDFELDMLEATRSGELPANGYFGLIKEGGNLENARALGIKASVDWVDVAEWLRRCGYTVARGKWIDFTETLERLQARLRPPPTEAELETWAAAGLLTAYVDGRAPAKPRYYQVDTEMLGNPHADERRIRLWFDSLDVDRFEPETRWLTVKQLAQRWGITEARVISQLRMFRDSFVIWWTNGDCPPVSSTDQAFEAAVVALEHVEEVEKAQEWTPIEPPAQATEPAAVEAAAKVVELPAARPMKRAALIRLMRKTYQQTDTWFAKTGPGSIREAAKLPQHGMWDAAAALRWAEERTGRRAAVDDWPGVAV